MFIHLLVNDITPTVLLFEKFQEALTIDYLQQTNSTDAALQLCLNNLVKICINCGVRLSDFGLPSPAEHINEILAEYVYFDYTKNYLLQQSSETQ
jgi:hypothetical protein